jgi:hypothetical protein
MAVFPCIQIFFDTLLNLAELYQPWKLEELWWNRVDFKMEDAFRHFEDLFGNRHSCSHGQHQSQIAPIISAAVLWTLLPAYLQFRVIAIVASWRGELWKLKPTHGVARPQVVIRKVSQRLLQDSLLYLFNARREILEPEATWKEHVAVELHRIGKSAEVSQKGHLWRMAEPGKQYF